MHNVAFARLGLNWRYLAFEVHPKDLRTAIAGAKAMGFAGLNLTVPHKLLALDMVNELDESAKIWGAVNTIKFKVHSPESAFRGRQATKTRTIGYNTDADALVAALRRDLGLKLRGKKVLVLGAGGAGRTAALKLAAEKVAELFLVNRTHRKAERLAVEIKQRFSSVKISVSYPKSDVDLILNATSLGLKTDDPLPFDGKRFSLKQTRAVYDMIYRPAETRLLKSARSAGCRTANGLGMLLYQGVAAFEIWTGKRAPLDVMRRTLEQEVYGH